MLSNDGNIFEDDDDQEFTVVLGNGSDSSGYQHQLEQIDHSQPEKLEGKGWNLWKMASNNCNIATRNHGSI